MVESLLFPSHIVINYHSDFSPHKMTIPTRAWSSTVGTHGFGGYTAWDASAVDAQDMVEDLVTLMLPFFKDDVHFDDWTIYNWLSEDGPAVPVTSNGVTAMTGSSVSDTPSAAWQGTLNMFDTEFHRGKLVFLDIPSGTGARLIKPADFDVSILALVTEFTLPATAWATRWGLQPSTPRSFKVTLNNALERAYRI